jgi:lipoyl-dependent peroxiredoxin
VHVPDVDLATVQELADLAHEETCPYSKATRGNIEVTITAV